MTAYPDRGILELTLELPDLNRIVLVLDASVAINLLGSGSSIAIMEAIPSRIVMESRAYRELRRHPIKGCDLHSELGRWTDNALLEVVSLHDSDRQVFDGLTNPRLESTLDDGEAATIAWAIGTGEHAVPVIDERKATKLFQRRWPQRRLIDSGILFRTIRESGLLTEETVREAVYSALLHARMRVSNEMKPWVVNLIGEERAGHCPSLGLRRNPLR